MISLILFLGNCKQEVLCCFFCILNAMGKLNGHTPQGLLANPNPNPKAENADFSQIDHFGEVIVLTGVSVSHYPKLGTKLFASQNWPQFCLVRYSRAGWRTPGRGGWAAVGRVGGPGC